MSKPRRRKIEAPTSPGNKRVVDEGADRVHSGFDIGSALSPFVGGEVQDVDISKQPLVEWLRGSSSSVHNKLASIVSYFLITQKVGIEVSFTPKYTYIFEHGYPV